MYKLWWAEVLNATYWVSWKLASRFWRRRFLSGFYQIWAWQPSWSGDPDFTIKLSLPLPMDVPHKILLWLAKGFQRWKCLKSVYGRQTLAMVKRWPWSKLITTFIYSISCLHLTLFRSQAAIVLKKSIVFTFSHVKAYVSKIDLAVK